MIEIKMDTTFDGFKSQNGEDPASIKNAEIIRILKELCKTIKSASDNGVNWNSIKLFDRNGNIVGECADIKD